MSQVEDRLRTALASAPPAVTTIADPIADLERRIGTARVRLGGIAIAVVAVVVAAIIVPFALSGSSKSEQPLQAPLIPFPATSRVTSVTAGGGAVWSVASVPNPFTERYVLQRRNPVTGRVEVTYRLKSPETYVSYGAGRVWAFGGGDGGYPMGQLRIVDPGRRPSTDLRLGNGKGLYIGPSSSLAFNADRAFGVREDGRRIYVFDAANPSSPVSGSFAVAHAHQVYLSGDTLVVVGRTGGGVRRVTAQFDHVGGIGSPLPSAPDTITIRGVPVGNAPGGLWCWLGDRLVRENVTGDQLGAAIPLFAEPVMALSAPDGGLFVEAVPQATVAGRSTRLFYYSPSAVASGASSPTVIKRQPVDDLSLDPAGGVIVGHRPFAGGEKIYRWNPAAAS